MPHSTIQYVILQAKIGKPGSADPLATARMPSTAGPPATACYSMVTPESVATLPPFGPLEGQKWFDQISSQ
jgi:hypothetical protein